MKDAIAAEIETLPADLRQTLTWDRGKELAAHAQLSMDTGAVVHELPTWCCGSARVG